VKIRFQADADIDPDIGRGVCRREPSIDWRAAKGTIPNGTSDTQVLRLAANDGRVLVSADVNTMPLHFDAFVATEKSPGVVLIPAAVSIGEAIERLVVLWLATSADDIRGQIWWLPR
jgi:hypothetical protein